MVRRLVKVAILMSALISLERVSADTLISQQQQGDTLTLADVVKDVLSHNDRIVAARYIEQAARSKISPSGAWDDPMLMLGVVNLPTSWDFKEDGMTMRMVGLSQNIPYARHKGLQSKAAQAEADAATAEREMTEVELAVAGKTAYLNLYYRQLIVQDLKAQQQLAQDIVDAATSLFESNKAILADVLAAQIDLWRLDTDILSAEQEVDDALYMLLSLMGQYPDSTRPPVLSEPAFPILPPSIDPWMEAAQKHYPPLQQLSHRSNSFSFSAAASKRMRWPMLKVGASYGFRSDSPTENRKDMLGFQVTLSLPLFTGRQQGAMAASMEAMHNSLDAEARQMVRDIEAELKTHRERIERIALVRSYYAERIIPSDEDAYQSALTAYRANQMTMVDLLNYAQAVYRDRVMARQKALELGLAWVEVERYTEKPEDRYGESGLKRK